QRGRHRSGRRRRRDGRSSGRGRGGGRRPGCGGSVALFQVGDNVFLGDAASPAGPRDGAHIDLFFLGQPPPGGGQGQIGGGGSRGRSRRGRGLALLVPSRRRGDRGGRGLAGLLALVLVGRRGSRSLFVQVADDGADFHLAPLGSGNVQNTRDGG